jgi:asparagine synthase (glutamine-hydrolysing)
MNEVIAHRGPDDQGLEWFPDSSSGLAHRRLSIIDLSPAGHRPMCNDIGDLWIVFNGEIYNHEELREEISDRGVRFSRRHFAARDRLGIKPLYYYFQKGCLLISSEIKAILNSALVPRRPDLQALYTPARFQISPLTGFQDIFKLPPAHYMLLADGNLSLHRYWMIHASEQPANGTALIEQLDALLSDSVRLQMRADVPVGVFLSGGLDSSIISALMRRNTQQEVHSFTIKFSGEDQKFERMTPDEIYARQVANQFGFTYHEFTLRPQVAELLPKMVWHVDEPVSDPAIGFEPMKCAYN